MYDKLVRDKIPEIIRENDEEPITRKADEEEYSDRLAEKLVEEAIEFQEDRNIEELADLMEVVEAILDHENISKSEIDEIKENKAQLKGRFNDRIVLDDVKE